MQYSVYCIQYIYTLYHLFIFAYLSFADKIHFNYIIKYVTHKPFKYFSLSVMNKLRMVRFFKSLIFTSSHYSILAFNHFRGEEGKAKFSEGFFISYICNDLPCWKKNCFATGSLQWIFENTTLQWQHIKEKKLSLEVVWDNRHRWALNDKAL